MPKCNCLPTSISSAVCQGLLLSFFILISFILSSTSFGHSHLHFTGEPKTENNYWHATLGYTFLSGRAVIKTWIALWSDVMRLHCFNICMYQQHVLFLSLAHSHLWALQFSALSVHQNSLAVLLQVPNSDPTSGDTGAGNQDPVLGFSGLLKFICLPYKNSRAPRSSGLLFSSFYHTLLNEKEMRRGLLPDSVTQP